MKEGRARWARPLCIALAVVCALVSIASYGVELQPSFLGAIEFNGPSVAEANDDFVAVVDSESKRVLILDSNRNLVGLFDCEVPNSPIASVTDVCVSGDGVYVAGVVYEGDSDIIECERVVALTKHGRYEKTVYEWSGGASQVPVIKSLDHGDEGVYVLLVAFDGEQTLASNVHVIHATRSGAKEYARNSVPLLFLYDVGFSKKANTLKYIDMQGALRDGDDVGIGKASRVSKRKDSERPAVDSDHIFTSVDVADDGMAYLYDDTASAVVGLGADGILRPVMSGRGRSSISVNGMMLSVCDRVGDRVFVRDLDEGTTEELSYVELSSGVKVLLGGVIACRWYLVAFVVVTSLLKLRNMIRQGNTASIGPMFASVVVVLVVALAIGYTSYGSYMALIETRAEEINTFADYLDSISYMMSDYAEDCGDRKLFRSNTEDAAAVMESLVSLEMTINGLVSAATANGVGTYVACYVKDELGVFYLFDSGMEYVIGTSIDGAANRDEILEVFETGKTDRTLREGRLLHDTTQHRLVRIPATDGEGTAGVIEIGSRLKTFESSITEYQIQRIITLLVMVLVVYLTYSELRACAGCFWSYGQMHHKHDAIAVLTRPFSFFVTLLSSIDAVMTTLIARSLLQSSGMAGSSVLLALPSVTLGVGLALGQAIYALAGSKVIIRKLMMRGSIAMIITSAFTAIAVWSGVFWLYCLAKLAMAIPFGLLYTLSYSLPRRADSDEVRALAASGIKRTDTSAAALGTVLGGFVAQQLGNEWVYVLVAVASVIVLIMASALLPRSKHPLEKEIPKVQNGRQALLRLLTSKTTVPIVLFAMFPVTLAAGYNSFLFPLYTANLGVPTSSINALFVLGQLVVYVCIAQIEALEGRYDKWRVANLSVLLLGVVFLLFSFNTTLVWAVVTIALVGVLCKAGDGWKALWPRSAKACGLTTGIATGAMFATRSVLLIVQSLVLGALLSVGDSMAVIVLGVFCLVCAAAFYFLTRKTPLAPEKQ